MNKIYLWWLQNEYCIEDIILKEEPTTRRLRIVAQMKAVVEEHKLNKLLPRRSNISNTIKKTSKKIYWRKNSEKRKSSRKKKI